MKQFSSKVILITGAAAGVGNAIAEAFSKQKACLSLVDINEEKLKNVATACKEAGAEKVFTILADLRELANTERIMKDTIEEFGKLDVLCNNAGVLAFGGIEDPNIEKFDDIFHVNLRAPLHLTHLAIPHLEKTKGCIINTSSMGSKMVHKDIVLYSLTKAGLDCLTNTTAAALAEKGIRVNSINPSYMNTDIGVNAGSSRESTDKGYAAAAKKHPLGGVNIEVEDAAQAVLFLASEEARTITGTNLMLDRGRFVSGSV